jgi:hypothetical protein
MVNPSLFPVLLGDFSKFFYQMVGTRGTRESAFFTLPPFQVLCLMLARHFYFSQVVVGRKYQDPGSDKAEIQKSK